MSRFRACTIIKEVPDGFLFGVLDVLLAPPFMAALIALINMVESRTCRATTM